LFVSYDKELFKGYEPNAKYYFVQSGIDGGDSILVEINEDGYRGPLMPINKRENEYRTLLLGDSFLGSVQVAYENTLGQCLGRLTVDSLSFLQHGFHSYSPLLEFNWILKKGLKYNPDRILLFLYPNDFFSANYVGDLGYVPFTVFNNEGHPDYFDFSYVLQEQSSILDKILLNHLNKLESYKLVSLKFQAYQFRKLREKYSVDSILNLPPDEFLHLYQSKTASDPMQSAMWDLYSLLRDENLFDTKTRERVDYSLNVLTMLKDYLDDKEIELGLVYIPWAHQIPAKNLPFASNLIYGDTVLPKSGLQDELTAFCKDQSIPFLDLYTPFMNAAQLYMDEPIYFPQNAHLTIRGHDLVAKEVYKHFFEIHE